jgi:phosphoribosylcarboxyaminoimidazole (NCAIR) mutase
MAYDTADILAAARLIRAHLDELVGDEAAQVRPRLDELIDHADDDPKAGTRILALLRPYPAAYAWIRRYLEPVLGDGGGADDGGYAEVYAEKSLTLPPDVLADFADEPAREPSRDVPETVTPETVTPETVTPETVVPETVVPETVTPETVTPETVVPDIPDPGLLLGPTDDRPAGSPPPAEPADRRYFTAELEDHPAGEPLRTGQQSTIAFGVGPWSATALATAAFPDEILAAADPAIDVFQLTVQLDSDDFDILGATTRPLRVPRAGRGLGKARFDIMPRHDGDCELVATVHHDGNFVHQVKLTIPVGGQVQAPVAVTSLGRPPELTAALEPRDILIVLEPAPAGGFACTVSGPVAGRTVLPITAAELNAATTAARQAMMSVITSVHDGVPVFQTGIDIPAEAGDKALRTMARAGAGLFQRLFLHDAAGDDARAIGRWLRDNAMDPGVRLTVQIIADHAPLPWAMLYLGDAASTARLDWDCFLGMRHIIEQLPLQQSLRTRTNEIPSKPSLAMSLNMNRSIDTSLGMPLVVGHERHWTEAAAARAGLTVVSRATKDEVVRALADAANGDRIVYFYCHATGSAAGSDDPETAQIIMGQGDATTVADLRLDAPVTVQLSGNPLIFINACESAELTPLFYSGFVPYFMSKGARGVIGTECKTPAIFAIRWADAFFEQILDGATVGATVLKLRQDFLRSHGNPLGLIYAVHCDADTRVTPALARAQTAAN